MTQETDHNTPDLCKSIYIAATPDTVWGYLTDQNKLGLWYLPAAASLTAAGQRYALHSPTADEPDKPQVWGQVLEMEKPSRLVTTFCINPLGSAETRVVWTLRELAGGTQLLMEHFGIAEAAQADMAAGICGALDVGWDGHLSKLRSLANKPNRPTDDDDSVSDEV